jgi:uncharacterized protein
LTWTWDQNKAAINLAKHKISFELGQRVFGDPYHQSRPDPYPGEERWQTIGMPYASSPTVLFVVHTQMDDDGYGRIISARKATSHERKAYEKGEF